MAETPPESRRTDTDRLDQKQLRSVSGLEQVVYRPVPHKETAEHPGKRTVWRVRFDLATDTSICFGLDINDEVILGRGSDDPQVIDLRPYGADDLGVSRRHLKLRPTASNLYAIDLGSTNGTLRNDRSIGVNTPYSLVNGDILTLGRLQLIVRIIRRPPSTATLREKADLGEALTTLASSLTSQLNLDEVLSRSLEMAMTLTDAGETAIWLVDQESGELYLEAERGIEDEQIRRMRLPASNELLSRVIESGQPLRASREAEGKQIKVKTGYLVESLIYVPLKLGGMTFGVLMATHREPGKKFSTRDEKLLTAIAGFAAIAIQNSRVFQATDNELAARVEELAALNELSYSLSSSLDLKQVHKVLIEQVSRQWDVEAALLWLVDEKTNTLTVFRSDDNRDRDRTDRFVRIGQGIVGMVAKHGERVVINDLQAHPDYDAKIDTASGRKAKSMACVPLLIQERVVGVLALFDKRSGPFTNRDIERLQAFASPVATAIENSRLFAHSEQQRATILATANTLSQPLIILDENGDVIVSNKAAQKLLQTNLAQLFEGLSGSVGRTTEVTIGNETYLTTVEHAPGVGTIIIMQDITYVKQLEQAREEFVHALSHDLKSPLTSIKGWAYLLGELGPLDDKRRNFLGRITEAANRTLGMVDQLLDVALLSETSQARRLPCDLRATVQQVIHDLEGAALAKSIRLVYHEQGAPYTILGDGHRLYRSILNLVDNAIKYSPDDTTVTCSLDFGEQAITVRVRDCGPGIPEEDIPHLFEKYFRGRWRDSDKVGVGLGLAMVRATVTAHGGTITVRNCEEGGAEFVVTLPRPAPNGK